MQENFAQNLAQLIGLLDLRAELIGQNLAQLIGQLIGQNLAQLIGLLDL